MQVLPVLQVQPEIQDPQVLKEILAQLDLPVLRVQIQQFQDQPVQQVLQDRPVLREIKE